MGQELPGELRVRRGASGAEVARLEQRDAEAMRLFERAIACARSSGFVQHEALASEVAGRFYLSREIDKVARVYLEQARDGYSRWGADAKVRQLERLYGLQPAEGPAEMSASCTVSAPVEQLDLATVLKVSEAVAGEIEPERLLEMLIRTAVEQAGADTGVLLLARGSELRAEAQATTEGGELRVGCAVPAWRRGSPGVSSMGSSAPTSGFSSTTWSGSGTRL